MGQGKDSGGGRKRPRDESGFDGHASANAKRQSEWRKRHPEKHRENQKKLRERRKHE